MCDHCDALRRVLTDLLGGKVADVIVKRVIGELHGEAKVGEGSSQLERAQVSVQSHNAGSRSVVVRGGALAHAETYSVNCFDLY